MGEIVENPWKTFKHIFDFVCDKQFQTNMQMQKE